MMFVRWKSRQLAADVAHSAILVESVRIDGKPRQRFIAHLGTIRPRYGAVAVIAFWHDVDNVLDQIDCDREHVTAQIVKRVPRPSQALIDSVRAAREKAEARIP